MPRGVGFGIRLVGDKELKRAFKQLARLDERKKNTIVRQALGKAAKPILKNARARVPVESGLLKKSLGVKTKTYRRSGVSIAVIGPRKGFKTKVGGVKTRVGSAKGDETRQVRNPAKYAHLVELGTEHSAAKPFLEPALGNNRQTVLNTFRREIPRRLIRLAQKLAKKK